MESLIPNQKQPEQTLYSTTDQDSKNGPQVPELSSEKVIQVNDFLRENTAVLSSIVGLEGVEFEVGGGYSTNMKTGKVTLDARALMYDKPDWNIQGILHELVAHLRDKIDEPDTNSEILEYMRRGEAFSLLHNIASDIKGNMEIVKTLPSMMSITDELYKEGLFPQADLRQKPRHVQFLYALIMQEMALEEERQIMIDDDVADEIAALRDFQGSGQDAIKYATASYEDGQPVPALSTLVRTKTILEPVMLRLLEKDEDDKKKQDHSNEPNQGQGEDGDEGSSGQEQSGEDNKDAENGEQSGEDNKDTENGEQSGKDNQEQEGSGGSSGDFDDDYSELAKALHPGGSDEEMMDEEDLAKKISAAKEKKAAESSPEAIRDKKMKEETGYSSREYDRYHKILDRYATTIEEMNDFFDRLVSWHREKRKKLSSPVPEGEIIDPEALAQVYAEAEAGVSSPPAFHKHEEVETSQQVASHFDIILVMDRSGSMSGHSAVVAAESASIVMEGLDYFMSEIAQVEASDDIYLDMDVRSAAYVFSDDAVCLKPLSASLNRKERLEVFYETQKADGGTNDYLALEAVRRDLAADSDTSSPARHQLVLVMSDGGSSNPPELHSAIDALKAQGCIVIGIGIENTAVTQQYGADGIDLPDIEKLPNLLISLIEKHIQTT